MSNDCKCCDCIQAESFRMITRTYDGVDNNETKTVVDNDNRTIEVKLKSQQYSSKYAFPNRGDESILYIAVRESELYRWDKKNKKYVCVGTDFSQIKIINGGTANGY